MRAHPNGGATHGTPILDPPPPPAAETAPQQEGSMFKKLLLVAAAIGAVAYAIFRKNTKDDEFTFTELPPDRPAG